MTAFQLSKGLQFIVSRVGDGHYMRATRHRIVFDISRTSFTFDEQQFLADHCSIYSLGDGGGFVCYPYSTEKDDD